jgi:hypothetical protein
MPVSRLHRLCLFKVKEGERKKGKERELGREDGKSEMRIVVVVWDISCYLLAV